MSRARRAGDVVRVPCDTCVFSPCPLCGNLVALAVDSCTVASSAPRCCTHNCLPLGSVGVNSEKNFCASLGMYPWFKNKILYNKSINNNIKLLFISWGYYILVLGPFLNSQTSWFK